MAVDDLWRLRDGTPSKRDGRGRRWRVRVPGYPATLHRTRAEAQAVELRRLREGPPTPVSSATVGELLDRWLVGKSGLSAKGQRACRSAVRQVRPRWDAVLVTDVRRTDVVEWLAGLQSLDMRAPRPVGGTLPTALVPAAGSTRAKALRALSGAMDIALDLGLVESNPCQKVSPGPQARRAVVTLTPAELGALADAAEPDGGMVWLLGATGLRIGEACALDVGDVDVRRRRLLVRQAKAGGPREVPVPALVLARLDLSRERGAPLFTAERMIQTSLTKAQFNKIITAEFGAEADASKAVQTRRGNVVEQMMTLFAEAGTQKGVRNTRWAGYNAITEYADHFQPVFAKGGNEAEMRAQRVILGAGTDIKQRAYELFRVGA